MTVAPYAPPDRLREDRLGWIVGSLLAAASLLAGCGSGFVPAESSEDALEQAGVKTTWVSPTGDTSPEALKAARSKCYQDLRDNSEMQHVPAQVIQDCLIRKGWTRKQG